MLGFPEASLDVVDTYVPFMCDKSSQSRFFGSIVLKHVFDAEFDELEVKPTIFPYSQLRTATRDFHLDMKLGQGAFGEVYKVIFSK